MVPTQRPADSERQVITDLVVGNASLVAVGFETLRDERGLRAASWISDDGARWQRVADSVANGNSERSEAMTSVAAGELGFAAAGSSHAGHPDEQPRAAFWTSREGVRWRRTPARGVTFSGWVADLAAGKGGFVAVGGDGRNAAVWTSVDGDAWTRAPHDETAFGDERTMFGVAATDEGYVAVGYDNSTDFGAGAERAVVWTSAGGDHWVEVTKNDRLFAGPRLPQAVTAAEGKITAVGHENAGGHFDTVVWTQSRGTSWKRARGAGAAFGGFGNQLAYGVAIGPKRTVAVGADYVRGPQPAVWLSPLHVR